MKLRMPATPGPGDHGNTDKNASFSIFSSGCKQPNFSTVSIGAGVIADLCRGKDNASSGNTLQN